MRVLILEVCVNTDLFFYSCSVLWPIKQSHITYLWLITIIFSPIIFVLVDCLFLHILFHPRFQVPWKFPCLTFMFCWNKFIICVNYLCFVGWSLKHNHNFLEYENVYPLHTFPFEQDWNYINLGRVFIK